MCVEYLDMQAPDQSPIDLVRIDPKQNMARFYGIAIQPTLFGEVSVVRFWGRIGSRGRTMSVTYVDAEGAVDACENLEHQKRKRGYVGADS